MSARRSGLGAVVGLIGLAVLFALALFLFGLIASYDSSAPMTPTGPAQTVAVPTPAPTPQEDEPGWDCRIHGNQRCGEVRP
jgi:hypothetical protein